MRTSLNIFTIALLMSLLFSTGLRGQSRQSELTLRFKLKETSLDTTYLSNGENLDALRKELASVDFIDSISVIVTSSPEGSYQFNSRLAAARAAETRNFLQKMSAGVLTPDKIGVTVIEEDWQGLAAMVQENYNGSDKDKIISIINAEGISDATREWRLDRLNEGRTWKLLKREYCPWLRQAAVLRIYRKMPLVTEPRRDSLAAKTLGIRCPLESGAKRNDIHPAPPTIKNQEKSSDSHSIGFNLRTNMLYDAMLVPNIGAEVHLGKGWALNASWNYAWWALRSKHYFWRIYGGEFGVRKYLKALEPEHPMSGHHVGLYGQAYTYDFETGGKGQISELSYGAGAEYGYTLPVGKRIDIDFSIGIGYLTGEYKTYIPDEGCYVWQTTAQRHWIGPTKAEITLVWRIGRP